MECNYRSRPAARRKNLHERVTVSTPDFREPEKPVKPVKRE